MDSSRISKPTASWRLEECACEVLHLSASHLEERQRMVADVLWLDSEDDLCSEDNILCRSSSASLATLLPPFPDIRWHFLGVAEAMNEADGHIRQTVVSSGAYSLCLVTGDSLQIIIESSVRDIVCHVGHNSAFYIFGAQLGADLDSVLLNFHEHVEKIEKLWAALIRQPVGDPIFLENSGICIQVVSVGDNETDALCISGDRELLNKILLLGTPKN